MIALETVNLRPSRTEQITSAWGEFAGSWQALHGTGADSCDEMVSGLQHAAAAREWIADNW